MEGPIELDCCRIDIRDGVPSIEFLCRHNRVFINEQPIKLEDYEALRVCRCIRSIRGETALVSTRHGNHDIFIENSIPFTVTIKSVSVGKTYKFTMCIFMVLTIILTLKIFYMMYFGNAKE